MEEQEVQKTTSLTETFMSKLKEQSFAILLCLGIVYYQHELMQKFHEEMNTKMTTCDARYEKMVGEERERLIAREAYLIKQRDEFIEIIKKVKVE